VLQAPMFDGLFLDGGALGKDLLVASEVCIGRRHLEAGKRRLAGDTARAATNDEVKDLRREALALKECVADLTLENRLLKKSMIADGGDQE